MGLLHLLVAYGFCPDIIRKGNSIILLGIQDLDLRFVSSNSYVDGTENEIAKQFGILFSPLFFPFEFLKTHPINYIGKIPNKLHYFDIFDTESIRQEKEEFIKII